MQILVVDGAGDAGKYLIKDLTQQGHTARILDLASMSPGLEADWF
jgi:nucleoside-diphosphate-sugar epimerase